MYQTFAFLMVEMRGVVLALCVSIVLVKVYATQSTSVIAKNGGCPPFS